MNPTQAAWLGIGQTSFLRGSYDSIPPEFPRSAFLPPLRRGVLYLVDMHKYGGRWADSGVKVAKSLRVG